ncbi:hypothetical protein J1N51_00620 [Psychrosphaera ytuae]|uniref:AB hydrolase-1 domain-containing protein n=1 Tax=Psychrosphaera ytuae TaxID=2820710 RepID=A0A975HIA1_9GAMM|nr:hypothetical protein [Psychrosphaera ytuae]QTH64036.1 hypothetical protein J1N51_00620 [Psychrosphaera ytuae]
MKVCIVVLFCLSLTGCAQFIADKITAPKDNQFSGNIDALISKTEFCDDLGYCIKGQQLKEVSSSSSSYQFKLNEQVWHFKSTKEDTPISHDPSSLILVFPGFNQPTEIVALHQQWIKHITGAEVIVFQSADMSVPFKFGLDFVSPVISLIEQKQPSQVHLIGFSMGALAAQAVSAQTSSIYTIETRLHLIAPMTDFHDSTLALWDIIHKDKLYSTFISDETVEEAVQLIYTNSNLSADDTDLVTKTKHSRIPTFVYASTNDRVTSAKDWRQVDSSHIKLHNYDKLNHIETVALTHTELLKDFVSNLINKEVSPTNTKVLGTICDINDRQCMTGLQAQ